MTYLQTVGCLIFRGQAAPLGLLSFYVFCSGPLWRLATKGIISKEFHETIYCPLVELIQQCHFMAGPFITLYAEYLNLWSDGKFVVNYGDVFGCPL